MAKIEKTINSKKDFQYRKGRCSLGFTLGTDNKDELKDFKDLLLEAVKDIEKILE